MCWSFLKRRPQAEMWPAGGPERCTSASEAGVPTVILVTGVNGVGKTTSIAKLCSRAQVRGRQVGAAGQRAIPSAPAPSANLRSGRERLGRARWSKAQQGGDPAAVAFDACQAAAVARRGRAHPGHRRPPAHAGPAHAATHQDPGSVVAKRKIEGGASRGAPGPGRDQRPERASGRLRQFSDGRRASQACSCPNSTARPGVASSIAIRHATSIPVKFIGVGETPQDVQPFEPDEFVEALFSDDA